MANYTNMFNHLSNLKIVVLAIDYTRPGSDFFQSLTNGHPEIVQFAGSFWFHTFWDGASSKEDINTLIEEFVYHTHNMRFFDSRFNFSERWNQLGPEKNEHFQVDIDAFKYHARELMRDREITSHNLFFAIHGAYALACGMDVLKTKVLFYHIHHLGLCERFKQDFSDFKTIIMTRDPRDGLVSYVEHRPISDHYYYDPRCYLPPLLTYSSIFYNAERYDDVLYIPLKDLHQKPEAVMRAFCEDLTLTFVPEILLQSSYHGKLWWGDRWSSFRNGFNPDFGKDQKWKNKLSILDNYLMEFLFRDQFRTFNYSIESSDLLYYLGFLFAPFLVFIPMRYEVVLFRYGLQAKKRSAPRTVALSVFSYLRRIKAYLSVYFKKSMRRKVKINKYDI